MSERAARLLAAYDAELRVPPQTALPAGASVERDGPLHRFRGFDGGGFVLYRDLGGLEGDDLDALIARQVQAFAARDEAFEWKLHGHDLPADLATRLAAAGFDAEQTETVLVAPADLAAATPELPGGVTLREVHGRADLDRIAALEAVIWNGDRSWLADSLEAELAADPSAIRILVAEHTEGLVSAGWVRVVAGTSFATLWGGGTLPGWRGRGVYRALVARRAALAHELGARSLQVDASEESRPVLERLGFVAVTTTTPFIWMPPSPR